MKRNTKSYKRIYFEINTYGARITVPKFARSNTAPGVAAMCVALAIAAKNKHRVVLVKPHRKGYLVTLQHVVRGKAVGAQYTCFIRLLEE